MRTHIIAEVASNHGGNVELAKEFVRVAAEHGADIVKFQSWQAKHLRSHDDPQHDWFVQSELSDAAHHVLIEECAKNKIGFLTTCFDVDRVPFLASLGLPMIKVGSADTGSVRLLRALRPHFQHILVSTGMATDEEVASACGALADGTFTLLHAMSLYPTPLRDAQLGRIRRFQAFATSVGYSDHVIGMTAVKHAVHMGVDYVEKHVCLGRSGPGRVMPWDMTPSDLERLRLHAERSAVVMGEGALSPEYLTPASRARFIGRFGDNR